MSLYDYDRARRVLRECASFAPLILAAVQVADTDNLDKLREVFPREVAEAVARHNAPSGVLATDTDAAPRLAERIDQEAFAARHLGREPIEIRERQHTALKAARDALGLPQ